MRVLHPNPRIKKLLTHGEFYNRVYKKIKIKHEKKIELKNPKGEL